MRPIRRVRPNLCILSIFRPDSCGIFPSPGGCIFSFVLLEYVAYNIFKGVIETDVHLSHSFKKLHCLMEQAINRRLLELDLTTAQGYVIGYLTHAAEPPCARDLEVSFGLSHATVSGILSRMESKGFIALEPDPKDRRVKRICLLEKGKACSRDIWDHIQQTEQLMSRGFTAEEQAAFRSFLSRAIQNLSNTNHSDREE